MRCQKLKKIARVAYDHKRIQNDDIELSKNLKRITNHKIELTQKIQTNTTINPSKISKTVNISLTNYEQEKKKKRHIHLPHL